MAKNLIVDLDYTLIDIDLLQLSLKKALYKNPFLIFLIPFWLIFGKGFLKEKLVSRVVICAVDLPYNQAVIDYVQTRKKVGDNIVLATASHYKYANLIANYLKLFDEVMASDKTFNLSSHHKAKKLIQKFGKNNFDYIGDHMRDIPVWQVSDLTIIVADAKPKVLKKTKGLNRILLGAN